MLTTLLAWIYITLLCWIWGELFFLSGKKVTKVDLKLPHFSVVCITGLAVITIIAGILSLFIPLGSWWVHLLFLAPCIILFLKKDSRYFFNTLKEEFLNVHLLSAILLFACFLLVLVMSTWTIIHPDTLGYHAQTIQWIEKYKAVPGLVHLHYRFGLQGLWFVDCALFGFSFFGKEGFTFLNSTVLVWFFIFVINRIDYNLFREGKKIYGLLWIALLFLTMWSYTQVRLTATSASADFIATLFVLTILYLLFQNTALDNWLLPVFLSITATTIKLSVVPILLIVAAATIMFLKNRKVTLLLALVLISTVSFFPFIARNIITSGYVVFPSTAIDVVNVDWKYKQQLTIHEKNYITAYAKRPGVEKKEEIDSVAKMSPLEWMPGWWQHQSMADKVILCLLVFSFLAALLSLNKIARAGFVTTFSLLTMLTGIIFWFISAPDPRFGFGHILGFIAIVAYLILKEKEITVNKTILSAVLVAFTVIIVAYTGYRFINFFSKDQLLTPLGIEKTQYKTFECDGSKINSPVGNDDFGTIPIPCTDLNCENFSARGNMITDGFKAK
jgi:hypothetical protein